jgi:hypothetical protein
MIGFLRRAFGCPHAHALREHRADGWYWVCPPCERVGLINPRERERPKAIGRYDERKAAEGKARAARTASQRQAVAARLSAPAKPRKIPKTNIVPMWRKK